MFKKGRIVAMIVCLICSLVLTFSMEAGATYLRSNSGAGVTEYEIQVNADPVVTKAAEVDTTLEYNLDPLGLTPGVDHTIKVRRSVDGTIWSGWTTIIYHQPTAPSLHFSEN